MIERLTPEEYEQRQISDIPEQEAYLDKELAEQAKLQRYIYGDPPAEPEPPPEEEKPKVQYVAVPQAPEKPFPWGLVVVSGIAVTGIILGITAIARK